MKQSSLKVILILFHFFNSCLSRVASPFAKVTGKEHVSANPPVSKVRPLMEDGASGTTEDGIPVSPGRAEG